MWIGMSLLGMMLSLPIQYSSNSHCNERTWWRRPIITMRVVSSKLSSIDRGGFKNHLFKERL
jgi:hypothetical protein